MRSRLQSVAVRGSMVSGETQDNEWIIKGSPVERKEFWYLSATAHATYIQSLFLLVSPGIPGSDDPWMPHANERHCCGFNANQYCANIHLRRWLHDETGPRLLEMQGVIRLVHRIAGKCLAMHECSSRCTQVITENKLQNTYNGEQINAVSECWECFFAKTCPPVEQVEWKKKPQAGQYLCQLGLSSTTLEKENGKEKDLTSCESCY